MSGMKSLKKYEFPAAIPFGRESKYDWIKALDGGIYQLTGGEEGAEDAFFTCSQAKFIAKVKATALKLFKNVNVAKHENGIDVVIQASDMNETEKTKAEVKLHGKAEKKVARKAEKKAKKAAARAAAEQEAEGDGQEQPEEEAA